MSAFALVIRNLAAALVDPAGSCERAGERPAPVIAVIGLLGAVVALGTSTLPRQLDLLAASLAPAGVLERDLHHQALAGGLERLIWVDRVVPPPTVMLAGILLVLAAEPLLGLARDARRKVVAVLVLGLVPLVVQRAGELAMTYLAAQPTPLSPGFALGVPQQFVTGPVLLWREGAPGWLTALSARANLLTAWSVLLWAHGLHRLDRGRWQAWHFTVPVVCLTVAGLLTWWFERPAVALILGRP